MEGQHQLVQKCNTGLGEIKAVHDLDAGLGVELRLVVEGRNSTSGDRLSLKCGFRRIIGFERSVHSNVNLTIFLILMAL